MRSPAYVGTVPNDEEGMAKVQLARATVRKVNYANKLAGKAERFRVVIRGRLGPNNPAAELYRRGGRLWRWSAMCYRPEHSVRFDVYVHRRYGY